MNKVRINKVNIEYQVFGEGIPLVYLHGGGTDFHYYMPFLKKLSEKYKIYTFSYPGFGYSGNWSRYTINKFIKLINEFVRAMGLEKFIIMGHSLGGGLALVYTALHQENVYYSVVLSPQVYRNRKTIKELLKSFKNENHSYIPGNANGIKYLTLLSKIRFQLNLYRLYRFISHNDLSKYLDKLNIKVLLLIDTKDLVVNVDDQQKVEKLLKNKVVIKSNEYGHNAFFALEDAIREQMNILDNKLI